MKNPLVSMETKGHIAIVRMNRPERKNALNVDLIEQLLEAARSLKRNKQVRVVILSGGPGGFSAGADRNDKRIFAPGTSVLEHWQSTEIGAEAVKAWESLNQVTIAAIERFAVGGGFTFAMACDFRVMGHSAFVTIPEVPLGFNYGWNSVPRMVSLIGPSRAKRVIMLGERIGAEQAERWGLADYVTGDGAVEAFAAELASQFVELPQLAVQFTKRAVNAITSASRDISSHADMAQIVLCLRASSEASRDEAL